MNAAPDTQPQWQCFRFICDVKISTEPYTLVEPADRVLGIVGWIPPGAGVAAGEDALYKHFPHKDAR